MRKVTEMPVTNKLLEMTWVMTKLLEVAYK